MECKIRKNIIIHCQSQFSVLYFDGCPAILNLISKIPEHLRKYIVIIDKFAYTDKLPSLNIYQKKESIEDISGIILDPSYYFITSNEINDYYNSGSLEIKRDLYIDTNDKFHQALALLIYGYNTDSLSKIKYFVKDKEKKNADFTKYVKTINKHENITKDCLLIGDSRSTNYCADKVENLSINGCTLAAFANSEVNLANISKLVVFLGINDLIYHYTSEEIRKNIEKLFLKVNKSGCKTLVMTNYKLLKRIEVYSQEVVILNNMIKECSENYGFTLYELDDITDDELVLKEQYSKDGIHLNEQGEKILYSIYNNFFEINLSKS